MRNRDGDKPKNCLWWVGGCVYFILNLVNRTAPGRPSRSVFHKLYHVPELRE